uniref:Gnk2-homologous domain-containing protein n=1 Tax=Solanum lycopersicum TaxID=4081 RepID=A0A3Q7G3F8_SOLLC
MDYSVLNMRALTSFIIIGFFGFTSFVKSEPNMKVVSYICNGNKYDMSGSFANSLAYVLEALQNETPISQGYNYYVTSPYPNDALAYGHATCSSSLINSDCAICANYAKSYLMTACDRGIGAQIELIDCSMRYEQYSFT